MSDSSSLSKGPASTVPESTRPLEASGVPRPSLGSRALFPQLSYTSYLAHAAISPVSVAVSTAVSSCMLDVATRGTASFPCWMAQRERLRTLLATLLHTANDAIALTPGCTRGISDIALALNWPKGKGLLGYRGEFPANVTPFQLAAEANDSFVDLADLPNPTSKQCADQLLSDLRARLQTGRYAHLAVSAVQFQSGLAMPLQEISAICRENGVSCLVDGIQGCGVVPYDLTQLRVQAFFSGAHKWLLGLEGAGFMYAEPQFASQLKPLTAGWLSHQEGENFLFQGAGHLKYDRALHQAPRVFEGSTANAVGLVALEAGVEIVSSLGPDVIFDHVQKYHDLVEAGLLERGFQSLRASDPALRSCILSFRAPEDVASPALVQALDSLGVRISNPDGLVRIAPHFSNSLEEVPPLLEAFDQALKICR